MLTAIGILELFLERENALSCQRSGVAAGREKARWGGDTEVGGLNSTETAQGQGGRMRLDRQPGTKGTTDQREETPRKSRGSSFSSEV